MSTDRSTVRGSDDDSPSDDDFTTFLSVLHELKTTGCSLLVVGETPREVFTEASSELLGDTGALRYRILAVTDVTTQSVLDRLPDAKATPRPLAETTTILNHAGAPRSVTNPAHRHAPSFLSEIEETCITDPQLRGLESALTEAITEVASESTILRPADLRVCLDSLDPLLDHYEMPVVKRFLDTARRYTHEYSAMAHFVLREAFDSECVQTLAESVDAIIELRTVDPDEYDHEAEQRWHVPEENITTEWTPL